MVPVGGIMLITNGLNAGIMDPNDFPDFCTIIANILPPQAVYGYLFQDDMVTPIPGVVVTFKEVATGETIADTTDASGRYAVDLNVLLLGFTNGDDIEVSTPAPNQAWTGDMLDTSGPAQQLDLIVDTTIPVIGATTVDKPFINSQGTFGGIAPPVLVTVADVTDNRNLGVAAWGIRNENQSPNGTMYFTCDITNEIMPATYGWDGTWYFIDGVLVTVTISPFYGGTDLFVFGEVNGASFPGQVIGNNAPSHYANFDEFGNFGGVYSTLGTIDLGDDVLVTPIAFDTFRAYAYVEGDGYVATTSVSTFTVNPWVALFWALSIADTQTAYLPSWIGAIVKATQGLTVNEDNEDVAT
jgi:hypothetical protein